MNTTHASHDIGRAAGAAGGSRRRSSPSRWPRPSAAPSAAVPLKLDQPGGSAVSVDPSRAESSSEFGAKLHTTAGYRVLVFG